MLGRFMLKSGLLIVMISFVLTGSEVLANVDFTIPEATLLSSEFAGTSWGPATVSRTDIPGSAVQFSFTGLTTSGTGLKDDYPVGDYGQILPSHGSGDFSNFDGYILGFKNVGTTEVGVSLFINTGFTGSSGNPSNDGTNNTFWQSNWQSLLPGESAVVRLDFDNAVAWGIADNKFPHTQGTEGIATAINGYDRTEVSAIGFEITGDGEGAIQISPAVSTPAPGALLLGAMGMSLVSWLRRRRMV